MKPFQRMFSVPSALSLALRELQEAKRDFLVAQSASEYATKMAQYHQVRITRLEALLNSAAGK